MPGEPFLVAVNIRSKSIPEWNFASRHARMLEDALPGCHVVVCGSDDAFLDALPRATTALTWRFKQEWFGKALQLRWIVTPAAGREGIDITPPAGVEVWNSSFHGELISETVLAMLLAHFRGILVTQRSIEADPWPRERLAETMRPLRGANACILGYGHIGRWIGRYLSAFGVHVTGVRHHAPSDLCDDDRSGAERVLGIDDLPRAVTHVDILVLALPGTPETDDIVTRSVLARLAPRSVLVNVGRGNAIDEDALLEAVNEGNLEAAYLDVFKKEPLPDDSPLRMCPGVFVMPHGSAISPNYLDLFCGEFIERWREHMRLGRGGA